MIAAMAEFGSVDIIRNRARPSGKAADFVRPHVVKDRFGIDEAPNEPRASDAIDLRPLARHPLRRCLSRPPPCREALAPPFVDTACEKKCLDAAVNEPLRQPGAVA
jgi:hypothetical protein